MREKGLLADQIESLRDALNKLHQQDANLRKGKDKRKPEFLELIQKVDIFENEAILTKTMAEAFLDKVIVYDQYHIEIQWKWNDLIADLAVPNGLPQSHLH